jgi:uncharacterized protein (UPF0303 family)
MSYESDLRKIREQEATLVFPKFDAETAWQVGVALRDEIRAQGTAVVIDIRRGEHTLFFYAMEGTTPVNEDWARRKRNSVELLQQSSYAIGLDHLASGNTLEAELGVPSRDYACHGGCFPIRVRGAGFIGTITISGLVQRQDHGVVVAVLARLLGYDPAALALDPT